VARQRLPEVLSERARGATLKDVARLAEVHISTASRALDPARAQRLSDATIARVRSAADELGYTPDMIARGLKRGRTTTVGVVVADLENPFIGPVIRGIAGSLEEEGYVALVAETFDDHARFGRLLDHLVSRRVDAIITTAARFGDGQLLKRTTQHGLPIVLAIRSLPRSPLPSVVPDDSLGAAMAVDHLFELGHRVVAQLRGPADVSSFVERARGFQERVAELAMRDVSVTTTATAPSVAEGLKLMALTLGGHVRPTAVFAANDLMAIGAIDALRAHGLDCPGDLSVFGYNDGPLADHVSPSLSTVRMPMLELGRRAAELAMELIEDPIARPSRISFAPAVVVRASTGPVAAG
jgi:LacI family transcriptional regulator, galactose operon repressor